MKRIISFLFPAFILSVLIGRYYSDVKIVQTGVKLLLPVSIQEEGRDSFSAFVRLRYYNFIPIRDLAAEKGRVVVERLEDGRIKFISSFSDKPLRPREVVLKYVIVPSLPFNRKDVEIDILFSSDILRFSSEKKIRLSAVRYAVVSVDNEGEAVLIGLADKQGVILVHGLMPVTFHTL